MVPHPFRPMLAKGGRPQDPVAGLFALGLNSRAVSQMIGGQICIRARLPVVPSRQLKITALAAENQGLKPTVKRRLGGTASSRALIQTQHAHLCQKLNHQPRFTHSYWENSIWAISTITNEPTG